MESTCLYKNFKENMFNYVIYSADLKGPIKNREQFNLLYNLLLIIQVLVGNSDVNSLVINKFSPPFVARLVRIHPILQTTFGYLRLEFYVCTGTPDVFISTKQASCNRQNAVLYHDNFTMVTV